MPELIILFLYVQQVFPVTLRKLEFICDLGPGPGQGLSAAAWAGLCLDFWPGGGMMESLGHPARRLKRMFGTSIREPQNFGGCWKALRCTMLKQ